MPLRGKVAFPDTAHVVRGGQGNYVKGDRQGDRFGGQTALYLRAARDGKGRNHGGRHLFRRYGGAHQAGTQRPGGTLRILTEGLYRARARSVQFESGYYYAVTDEILSEHGDEVLEEAYFRTAREMVRDVLMADGKIGKDILSQLEACSDPILISI